MDLKVWELRMRSDEVITHVDQVSAEWLTL
jgi:hypothetical protein